MAKTPQKKRAPRAKPKADASPGTNPAEALEVKHRGLLHHIRKLPASVGVVLMGVGVAGFILPGPFGTPFFIAGGLVLAPKMFGRLDRFVEHRFPAFYWTSMKSVERFVADFEKRYPSRDRLPD